MPSFDPFGGGGLTPPAFGGPEYRGSAYTDLPSGRIGDIGLPGSYLPPSIPGNQNVSQPPGSGGFDLGDALKKFLTDPKNLAALIPLFASFSGGGGGGASTQESQRLNQITEEKVRRADPLHQAVTQLAWGRLPMNARQGITPPTYSPLTK